MFHSASGVSRWYLLSCTLVEWCNITVGRYGTEMSSALTSLMSCCFCDSVS